MQMQMLVLMLMQMLVLMLMQMLVLMLMLQMPPGFKTLCDDGARERTTACMQAEVANLPPGDGKEQMTAEVKEDGLQIALNKSKQ